MSGNLPGYVTNQDGVLPGYVTNTQGPAQFDFGNTIDNPSGPSNAYIGDALFVPYRAIGTIVPDVMIEEVNRDDLEITRHPVEFGSLITDHSYKQPVEVMLRVGWSNSGNYPGYINDVYNALIGLQASRQPFNVYTGKRAYINMLFASLVQVSNESSSDYSLMVQAMLREIIIVSTSSTTVPASSMPSRTSDITGPSNKNLQPVPYQQPLVPVAPRPGLA